MSISGPIALLIVISIVLIGITMIPPSYFDGLFSRISGSRDSEHDQSIALIKRIESNQSKG